MSLAHIIIVPAVHKGWGLIVTEGNAMGTPAIGYDVHGLRDSIKDDETGIIIKEKSPAAMAQQAILLLRDSERLSKYSRNALEFAGQFSWDTTVNLFQQVIENQN